MRFLSTLFMKQAKRLKAQARVNMLKEQFNSTFQKEYFQEEKKLFEKYHGKLPWEFEESISKFDRPIRQFNEGSYSQSYRNALISAFSTRI